MSGEKISTVEKVFIVWGAFLIISSCVLASLYAITDDSLFVDIFYAHFFVFVSTSVSVAAYNAIKNR
jgi:hypothetical protein